MDPFEVRMQFLSLLRRLNASQQSIQKVVTYALKYFSRCGEDLWDCVVEECQQGSLNTRINILYLLDSLCETSLLSKATSDSSSSFYVDFVARDLATIVDYVVPQGREGLINLMSAVQILENWRTKRVIDPQKIEDVLAKLDAQKAAMHAAAVNTSTASAPTSASVPNANTNTAGSDAASISNAPGPAGAGGESLTFSRNEIFKRIEEDRERHKRLRERRWVQPVSHAFSQPLLASFAPTSSASSVSTSSSTSTSAGVGTSTGVGTGIDTGTDTGGAPNTEEPPLDIEFDNEWETTSEWNEDDEEAVMEENALCYPNAATRLGPASASVSAAAAVSSVAAAVSSAATAPSVSCTPAPGRERDAPLTKSGSDSTSVQLSKRDAPSTSTSVPGPGAGPAPTTPTLTPAPAVTSIPTPTAPKKRVRIDRTRMHAAERRE